MNSYLHNTCYLCGSSEYESVFSELKIKTITSDGNGSNRELKKLNCLACGLVREGNDFNYDDLEEHYEEKYVINTKEAKEEHIFFKNGIPVPRNLAMANEIAEIIDEQTIESINQVFEIGAGQGGLIHHLKTLWPNKEINGVELSKEAIELAKQKGIFLKQGNETEIPENTDLVVAVTVFEHVPNPVEFLKNIYKKLSNNGSLVLIQPVQNGISYDIFYTDHLHHFNEKHVEWFGNLAGFKQEKLKLDTWFSGCMSLHYFKKIVVPIIPKIAFIDQLFVKKSVEFWLTVFNKVNEELKQSKYTNIAVYGMSEVLYLLNFFTDLNKHNIIVGIDDFPERHQNNSLKIPVFSANNLPEEIAKKIDVCILSTNKIYYPKLIENCNRLNINYIELF